MAYYWEPVKDGSAVLDHIGYDRMDWDKALALNPTLGESLAAEHNMAKLPTVGDLARDIFWSLHQTAPKIAPPAPLRASHTPHEAILEQAMLTPEYQQLRALGTQNDALIASAATAGMAADILAALPEEDQENIRRAHEAGQEALNAQAWAESLRDTTPAPGHEAAHQARVDQRAQAAAQAQAAIPGCTLSDAGADAARQAFRAAAGRAVAAAGAIKDAKEVFGMGIGKEHGDINGKLSDAGKRAALELARTVQANPLLARVAELAGRKIRLSLTAQIQRLDTEPEEVVGIEQGRDLSRILPTELLKITDPTMALTFFKGYAEGSLQQLKIEAPLPKFRGPMIIAVDHSTSMNGADHKGEPIAWAQALTQALIRKAAVQKRAVRVIAFSGPETKKVWDIDAQSNDPALAPSAARLMDIAGTFLGGGTDYTVWMEAAIEAVEQSAYDKADVILISDGMETPTEEAVARFNKLRAERGMRSIGILIGAVDYLGILARICDAQTSLADLADDTAATDLAFRI